jgi:hypothetical protein
MGFVSRQYSHLSENKICAQNKKKKRQKLTKIRQIRYIEILADRSSIGPGVELHEIF